MRHGLPCVTKRSPSTRVSGSASALPLTSEGSDLPPTAPVGTCPSGRPCRPRALTGCGAPCPRAPAPPPSTSSQPEPTLCTPPRGRTVHCGYSERTSHTSRRVCRARSGQHRAPCRRDGLPAHRRPHPSQLRGAPAPPLRRRHCRQRRRRRPQRLRHPPGWAAASSTLGRRRGATHAGHSHGSLQWGPHRDRTVVSPCLRGGAESQASARHHPELSRRSACRGPCPATRGAVCRGRSLPAPPAPRSQHRHRRRRPRRRRRPGRPCRGRCGRPHA